MLCSQINIVYTQALYLTAGIHKAKNILHMKKTIWILIGFIFWSFNIFSQNYEKVFLDSSDSTKFYFKVIPKVQEKGLLILLPGVRGNSEWPLRTSKIPYIAADSGLITIMINYETWVGWLRDDILNLLNESIINVLTDHEISRDNCVIGGFSSGGLMALTYTELAYMDSTKTAIIPKGVFGLDPPVDLIELYNVLHFEMQGYINNGEKVKISDETRCMHEKMTKYLGTPWENKTNYINNSPFIFNERYNTGGQAIYLKGVPVRIYSGIDNNYLISKANGSFYFDSSPYLISFLKQKGNKNATFKSQYDEDYLPDGGDKFRGRHTWEGFDSKECVDWILKTINKE
jgi:hypothetical protein